MRKPFIFLSIIVVMLCGGACAETMDTYTITSAQINMEAMMAYTFEEELPKAQMDTSRNYAFYDIPGSDGPPFCGSNHVDRPNQASLSMYRECSLGEIHEPRIWSNVEPSGIAKCKLTRDEALQRAEEITENLDLGEYILQSVAASGKLETAAGEYTVSFGQSLMGKPVYWSADSVIHEGEVRWESNRIQLVLGDCGLVYADGCWSQFEPAKNPKEIITNQQATEAFAQIGVHAEAPELCYFMIRNGTTARAMPAYRFQNKFLHAVTVEILQ